MRILVATDAWRPQVNGVVRTLEWLAAATRRLGTEIVFLTPERFASLPLPGYREIRLALASQRAVSAAIDAAAADAIHIATEGPIGFLTRRHCLQRGRVFTSCYHTRYPEYLAARLPVPLSVSYAALRRFHNAAAATMVATAPLASDLKARGFGKVRLWRRGIDAASFASGAPAALDLPRPIFLTVGRLAIEKNMAAFLKLDLPGSKLVIGDGPAREGLQARFPDAHFLGAQHGAALAALYRAADAFVFPSRTDTFGLVMLEALAAGVPVAAFPVEAPRAVLGDSNCGVLDADLRTAALAALAIPRERCRAYGARFTMEESAKSFLDIVAGTLRQAPALHAAFPLETA
jgi:glycosyltransferase involved in cell wall biosynthesis